MISTFLIGLLRQRELALNGRRLRVKKRSGLPTWSECPNHWQRRSQGQLIERSVG